MSNYLTKCQTSHFLVNIVCQDSYTIIYFFCSSIIFRIKINCPQFFPYINSHLLVKLYIYLLSSRAFVSFKFEIHKTKNKEERANTPLPDIRIVGFFDNGFFIVVEFTRRSRRRTAQ